MSPSSRMSETLFDSTGDEQIDAVLHAAIEVTKLHATVPDLDRLRDAVEVWGEADPTAYMDCWPERWHR